MDVNVTMTEEEYEDFKLFRQMESKDYLESQIKKNYSLLECLYLYGATSQTGFAEFFPSSGITKVNIHCESERDFIGGITVDISEHFKEYQGENSTRWIEPEELEELGVDLE